jgi:hypothetical protein
MDAHGRVIVCSIGRTDLMEEPASCVEESALCALDTRGRVALKFGLAKASESLIFQLPT